ncbi:hypothetical protein D9758_014351 [Tetrapyrgos nigripes]|uniref:Uncharacterized protein n=1 Tax=Tetrapyrgos nigripes TaxID=182062 RepID=A0A8H5C927_9AGAR|nr:hypothetical protein D9758_014351 [Tetrapyrgos nigripes]
MVKRNITDNEVEANEGGRSEERQQEPPRKKVREVQPEDGYDSDSDEAGGATILENGTGVETRLTRYNGVGAPRATRDLQYYDEDLAEDKAIIVQVEDIVTRVEREEIARFSSELAKTLDSKILDSKTPITEATPLQFADVKLHEWRALLWGLGASDLKVIKNQTELNRLISLVSISHKYGVRAFEQDGLSAFYDKCLPEHSDDYNDQPSILSECSPYTLGRLYAIVMHVLDLSSSSISFNDPLINPLAAPKLNKRQIKSKTLGKSGHPVYCRNIPIMILRHWIARLMPEAKDFTKPLPEPVQPEPSDTVEYPFLEDSVPALVPDYIPDYNKNTGISEVHAAACYALLRTRELSSTGPLSTSTPDQEIDVDVDMDVPMNGTSGVPAVDVSEEVFMSKLVAPTHFLYRDDAKLRFEDKMRILEGEQSLQRVWERVREFGVDLMPLPGSGPPSSSKASPGRTNGAGVGTNGQAKGSPKVKGKKGGKPRSKGTKAPDGSMDPMDLDEDEDESMGNSKEPSSKEPYQFGSGAARAFTFKAKGGDHAKDEDDEIKGPLGSQSSPSYKFNVPESPPRKRTGRFHTPNPQSPSQSPSPSQSQSQTSNGTNTTRSPPRAPGASSIFKFNFIDPHAPHAPNSEAHQDCKRSWGHAFQVATGTASPSASSPSSSWNQTNIPPFDVLALLARVEKTLTEDKKLLNPVDKHGRSLLQPDCKKGALVIVKKVREGVWKTLGKHFAVPEPRRRRLG